MPTPIPIDDVLGEKKPAGYTVELITDSALANAVNQAAARHTAAQAAHQRSSNASTAADLSDAARRLDEARAAARAVTRYWRFVSLGREAFEALRDAHPSTKAQRDEYRKKMLATGRMASEIGQLVWNNETFPPALIAASCVGVFATEAEADEAGPGEEPYLDVEAAAALWSSNRFNSAELDLLFSAALLANTQSRTADLGNG